MNYTVQLPKGKPPAMEHGAALIAAKACIDIWGTRGKVVRVSMKRGNRKTAKSRKGGVKR